jgi:hypothetical protein
MDAAARRGPVVAIATAAALGLTLLAPAGAGAHEIVKGPLVSGVPQEGQTLTATAEWTGGQATPAWKWQRCTVGPDQKCTVIQGATQTTYPIVAADVGFVLRVRLTLTSPHGVIAKRSKPTSVVQPLSAPAPPTEQTGEPEPEPGSGAGQEDPWGDPGDSKPFNPPANPVVTNAPADAAGLRVMKPFPVVRISGRLTASGAQITRLTVRAPRGSSIAAHCRGRNCPVRSFAQAASVGRLRAFERHLRAGTRLHVVVRKPERIGKWTTITIRRGAPPRRVDRCSYPGRARPAACPAA